METFDYAEALPYYPGGAYVDLAAPLDHIPVLVRDDAQIPLNVEVQ